MPNDDDLLAGFQVGAKVMPPIPSAPAVRPDDMDLFAGFQIGRQTIQAPVEKPRGSFFNAIADPALAIASGLAGTIAGGVAGAIVTPFAGAEKGSQVIKGVQDAATKFGAPSTQIGENALKNFGDVIQKGVDVARFPVSGLAGIAELATGQGADQAASTVKNIQDNGIGKTLGDRTFDKTGSPLLSAFAATSPEILGSLIPITKMAKTRSALKEKIIEQIKSGGTDKALHKYMINGAGKLKTDKAAIESVKQGFDQGVIAAVKGASDVDRAKMASMVDVMKRGKDNRLYGMKNRPSDIAGDSLLERVNHVKNVNKEAGKNIDIAAKSLVGKPVDFDPAINSFIDDLDQMGIKLDDKLRPNFKGSDIEGLTGPQRAINNVVRRMSSGDKGVPPDAYELHRMKRYIDEVVTYGKDGEGLTGKTERVLKKLRAELDNTLDSNFPDYNKANAEYSDTIGALNALRDVAGKKMNLSGQNADKAVGTLLRRIMSNAQSRVTLVDAVDSLENVSKKYGGKFKDDVSVQMLFADELDSVFGPVARTSLHGEVAKSVKTGAETVVGGRTATSVAIDSAASGIEKLRGINEENAFKSINELLKRNQKTK